MNCIAPRNSEVWDSIYCSDFCCCPTLVGKHMQWRSSQLEMKNLVILVALQKDASLRPTSKILLRNLTITDLCAGLISQPLAMTIFLSLITENWTLCRKAKNSAYIVTTVFFGVSLATLTSIAVERLLALFLGIRYGQVEIVRRTLTVVLFI